MGYVEYAQDVAYWTSMVQSAEEVNAPKEVLSEYQEAKEHALFMAQKEN